MNQQEVFEAVNGYLPHQVKIKILNYKSDHVGIENSHITGWYMLNGNLHFSYEGGSAGKTIFEIRFFLRPMSDLYKEVDYESDDKVQFASLIDDSDLSWLQTDYPDDWKNVSAGCLLFLQENYFDVNDLIGKGIAIKINI